MEGDQLSQIQGHLALTVLLYEVMRCLDKEYKCSIGTLLASYLVRIRFHSV